ncbi:hypothetical protein BX616_007784, partial [Lobosporangium transversale]
MAVVLDVVTKWDSILAMFKRHRGPMPATESLIIDAAAGPNQAESANHDRLLTLRLNSKEMSQGDELVDILGLINDMTIVFSSSISGYVAAVAPLATDSDSHEPEFNLTAELNRLIDQLEK